LREYMQRSKSLSILDLNDFIGEYEEGMQECREVLSLILFSEGICRNELATEFSSNFDLAGAFLDTSTNSHYHISDALREMKAESDERETEEMTQLWESIESICANNE